MKNDITTALKPDTGRTSSKAQAPKKTLAEQKSPDIVNQLVNQGAPAKKTVKPPVKPAAPKTNAPSRGAKAATTRPSTVSTESAAKPAAKPAARPAAKPAARPSTTRTPAPAARPAAKPAARPSTTRTPAPAAKPPAKPATRPTARPAAKPTTGATAKKAEPTSGTNTRATTTNAKPTPTRTNDKTTTPRPQTQRTTNRRPTSGRKSPLRIIPLGGMGEIGKNVTYYEYQNEALLVDCGMAFPNEEMLGVDIVIPDFEYIIRNRQKIRGLYITHGHEDHIGSIPYLLKDFNVPIYATKLTISLIENKLKERGLLNRAKLHTVKAGSTIKQGLLSVEFINVNHSIPDACSLAIHSPAGVVIQTGDFKVDYTPISGDVINLARFGELGSQGVLALLSDSTNAERPGSTPSERTVGDSFDKLFAEVPNKRIIVASFASNVYRVQQIIDAAHHYNRKVAVTGRSMENVFARALELGYLNVPKDTIIDIRHAEKMTPGNVVIVTTGSQGEPMSALTRMSRGDHRQISVTEHDRIIISATPIPGNEKSVGNVVNELLKTGADVIYERMYDVHVSGHACQDELKLLMALTKPKFFIPVHGEYRQLRKHAQLAKSMGIPESNIYIGDNGHVMDIQQTSLRSTERVQAGEVLVDGLGVGDVGSIVLRDRKHLSEDGLIVIMTTIDRKTGKIAAGPDIISRGFVYVREAEDMIGKACDIARKSIENSVKNNDRDWGTMKTRVRDDVSSYVWQQTKRSPMILPMIQEV